MIELAGLSPHPERLRIAPINVGLIGMGTVGTGVVEFFQQGGGENFNIHLKRVAVRDPNKSRLVAFSPISGNAKEILTDPNIHIVVELMGGEHPAGDYIREAINGGKSVVTANKVVVARSGKELFQAARSHGVDIGFEASVGGGIPIINVLNRFAGQRIDRVLAIVNGTTNYILTRMEDGMSFENALEIAQEKGFAEAMHTLDTGGFDARDKLAILASVIFNTSINPEAIYCEGITDITPADIDFAAKYGAEEGKPGYAVKLLASAIRHDGKLELHVYPALLSKNHPLANVKDEFNAIYVEGTLTGPQMYYGRGAGQKATTSAVISDILRVANNIRKGVTDDLPTLNTRWGLVDPKSIKNKGYIRVNLKHVPGSAAKIFAILAKQGINVADSLQRRGFGVEVDGKTYIPDIITTEPVAYGSIKKALEQVRQSSRTHGNPVYLRFED